MKTAVAIALLMAGYCGFVVLQPKRRPPEYDQVVRIAQERGCSVDDVIQSMKQGDWSPAYWNPK
jgi:hypothetical protein